MMLEGLEVPPHGTWYRVEHPRVMIRDAPSLQHGGVLEVVQEGSVLLVAYIECQEGTQWACLAAEEMHYCELSKSSTGAAWVLVDGGPLMLGILLKPAPKGAYPPLPLWSLPHELFLAHQHAAHSHLMRPVRVHYGELCPGSKVARRVTERYLCSWRAEESRPEAGEVGWHWDEVGHSDAVSVRPALRLGIALLLRDAPAACIECFLRYHLAVGFETIYLFFDDPSDETISLARRFAGGGPSGVVVTVCDAVFWDACLRDSPGHPPPDLQARQATVVQHAVRLAIASGIHWLLHIDIDELWYSPSPAACTNAPAFFAAVPDGVGELVFHNMEAVPPVEGTDCWFTDCTLFKPNEAFFKDLAVTQPSEAQLAQQSGLKGEKGGVGAMRKEDPFRTLLGVLTYSRAQVLGVNLLAASREHKKHAKDKHLSQSEVPQLFSFFSAYSNGKAAVRLLTADGSPIMPIPGVHRSRDIRGCSHICHGLGAPVILHYVNCGFDYWIRKFQMLASSPISAHGKEEVVHQPTEVAAHARRSDESDHMYVHRLSHEVVQGGDLEDARRFYRRSICLEGMLPRLASHGLLVRILFPSALLRCLGNVSG